MIEASAASDLGFWIDAIGRLVVATAAGMVLGWERSRENRQIMGLRTLGLVGLASCIAVQAIVHSGLPNVNADAAGRAMQGILSGVGFIGAGAVLKHGTHDRPLVIGAGSVVGCGSVVTKDVPPGVTVVGNPAAAMRPRLKAVG